MNLMLEMPIFFLTTMPSGSFTVFLSRMFKNNKIFRISCDEFVVLYPQISHSGFDFLLFMADRAFDNKQFILCGNAFSDEAVNLHLLIAKARTRLEEVMYENHAKLLEEESS